MSTVLDSVRIASALVSAALAANQFFGISYDATTHAPVVGAAVAPAQALANETRSVYADAKLNRRHGEKRERSSWTWELRIGFDQQVTGEAFEAKIAANPPVLPKDPNQVQGPRQITLKLTGATYQHPTQQQPASGTHVIYTFEAAMTPS